MRRLIINADDLGATPQRTHGILQCFEFGVVRSASLLANGSDSDAAARHARERGLRCGLHLTLTSDYPLSKPEDVASLVETSGQFFAMKRLQELLLEGNVLREHLERELRAQVEWGFDVHGQITHVSSHEHVHLYPQVIEALLPLLEGYGVRFVRIPCEEPLPPFGYEVPAHVLSDVAALNVRAKSAREHYLGSGIGTTDHFRGATLVGNASLKNLRHVLSRLPEGTTELMVHPGSQAAYGTPFDLDPQRQTELRMLLDETIPAMLAEKKIELCSWGDL